MRSGCPLNCALEFFGDKWSLLIVRELLFKGKRTFSQLLGMSEGISTGTLTGRVAMLRDDGIINRTSREDDRRSVDYGLTPKGKGLEPVIAEMILWAAENEMPGLPKDAVARLKRTRKLIPGPEDSE